MTAHRVAVIGGGLAGITAALDLREAGAEVTLLETKAWLGGLTCSFTRDGLTIDNGQHVFLRCCTAYQELLARLGMTSSAPVQERFDVTVLAPGGGQARLRRNGLPGPLHLAGALARYGLLPLRDRLAVGRAALGMRFADPASPELDRQRLGDWLAARGQGERARRLLWDLFVISALNIDGDDASAALAAVVIKTGLLGSNSAADIGMSAVPLGDLHGRAAASLLARVGVTVRLSTKVTALTPDPAGGFTVGLSAEAGPDAALRADAVAVALPAGLAARLVPAAAAGGEPGWGGLGTSPIVNVHVIYDRQVTRLPMAAAVDSPVQWIFDKTRPAGVTAGQYLAISVSAADRYVDVPVAQLRELFVPELERLFPAAKQASITDFFVTRERRATFRQGPGCGALRPGAATTLPGLALAGAWTDTGWPDTMEGAVRSGHNAAQELIRQLAQDSARLAAGPVPPAAAPVSS
jgi:squalene-associated FAD-dependent desaturase